MYRIWLSCSTDNHSFKLNAVLGTHSKRACEVEYLASENRLQMAGVCGFKRKTRRIGRFEMKITTLRENPWPSREALRTPRDPRTAGLEQYAWTTVI
ncbi:hypothetical protein TNCV_536241 [Trichonephila clavipes]|nr:hypothetical protein TNCV_536241 [Trichonephila clavipes]